MTDADVLRRAGDASVLYLNSMIDLSGQKGRGGTKELVLTVPPSAHNYYVVNLLDDFINTVGSIGMPIRTQISSVTTPASKSGTNVSNTSPNRRNTIHRRIAIERSA